MKLSHRIEDLCEFYKENGVKVVMPQSLRLLQSPCFHNYLTSSQSPNMAGAVYFCPKGLGWLAELTLLILDILNVPRDKQFLVQLNYTDYGSMVNGRWSGIVGDIMNGLYDTSFPVFTPLKGRLEAIDFSFPVLKSHVAYTTRWPNNSPGVEVSPLSVFSLSLWTAIITVGCLVGITIIIDWMVASRHRQSVIGIIWQLTERVMESVLLFTGFAISMNTSYSKRFWLRGTKIVLGLWALVAGIVASLYSGAILVKIVNQKPVLPFTDESSLAECVVAKRCYMVTESRTIQNTRRIVEALDLSEDEMKLHYAVLDNPFRVSMKMPEAIFNSDPELFPVLISSRISSDTYRYGDKEHSPSDYYVVNGAFLDPWCFPTHKRSNLTTALSYAIDIAQQTGLSDGIYHKYFVSTSEQKPSGQLPEPLDTKMLRGTFLHLKVGIACGVVLLAMEKVFQSLFPSKVLILNDPDMLHDAEYWRVQCENSWAELHHEIGSCSDASHQLQLLNEALRSWIHHDHSHQKSS